MYICIYDWYLLNTYIYPFIMMVSNSNVLVLISKFCENLVYVSDVV